jgi:hypothetical protein
MPKHFQTDLAMRTFTAIIERDPETKLYVGYIPGFRTERESEFIGVQTVVVS